MIETCERPRMTGSVCVAGVMEIGQDRRDESGRKQPDSKRACASPSDELHNCDRQKKPGELHPTLFSKQACRSPIP